MCVMMFSCYLIIYIVNYFIGTIKHYDGVIWPEIKDTSFCVNANVGLTTKAKNYIVGWFKGKKESTAASSGEQVLVDIKKLSESHHVELRKRALSIYLHGLRIILYGPEAVDNPTNIIRTIYAIYASLHNSYVYFNWHQADWRLTETTDVSI